MLAPNLLLVLVAASLESRTLVDPSPLDAHLVFRAPRELQSSPAPSPIPSPTPDLGTDPIEGSLDSESNIESGDDDNLGGGAIAGVTIASIVAVALALMLCAVITAEKKGTPMFMTLTENVQPPPAATTTATDDVKQDTF